MTSKTTRALVAAAAAGSLFLAPAMTPTAQAAPAASTVVARPGSHGTVVRTIQTDLTILGYYSTGVGGDFLSATTAGVKRWQAANGYPANAEVTQAQLNKMVSQANAVAAAKRAAAAKAAAAKAAAAKAAAANKAAQVIAKPGDNNATVKAIQGRLAGLGYLPSSSVIGLYGPQTTAAVKKFQAANKLPVTGVITYATNYTITQRFLSRPRVATPAVTLDSRCLTGRTICVNKSTRKMYWVVDGSIKASYDVRVGRPSLPTREGLFHIYLKSPNWWSTLYNVNMPYTQFFSGGEAVHYSVDFATNGYAGGGSHGCVNMNTRSGAAWLYSQTKVGDRVVVYK